ncbi:MAG TPA: sigma-70 family RNA polymerase sigma factor [Solirubrobacterales bacterium]|nr:sigma-70 family RNA polymerase sigma factor [Solirubrobacterales bacterium]
MYGPKTGEELDQGEFEAARLGFKQLLRCKRMSPQFIESHGDDLFATATLEYSRKLAEGEEIESPAGWLITCAWRRTKSQLEAESRRPRVVSAENCGPLVDEDHQGPEDALLDDDRFRKIRAAVEELPASHRRLLALSYFEGLTVREAARHLDWHSSKAQRAHESAKRKLQELLGVSSSDDLAVEIGVAAYVSIAAEGSAGNLLERAAQRSAEGLASLKQQIAEGGAQLKQHATATYYRAVDPTPLAAARPGTIATLVAGCIAIGSGATYCVEQGMNPVGAARSLIATTSEPEAPASTEPTEPSPAPVYTPVEPLPESEEAPVPETAPPPEEKPSPEPEAPPPEDSFEPVSPAYASGGGESESSESYEASEPAPVESAARPAPVAASAPPEFGGP